MISVCTFVQWQISLCPGRYYCPASRFKFGLFWKEVHWHRGEKNKSFGITCLSAANTFDDDEDKKHKGVFGFTVAKRKILRAFTATLFSRKFILFRLLPQLIPALSKTSFFLEEIFYDWFRCFSYFLVRRSENVLADAKYFGGFKF
jgi:hypothetical protein